MIAGVLAARTDPAIPDFNGRTPLHWSAASGDTALVTALLQVLCCFDCAAVAVCCDCAVCWYCTVTVL